MRGAAMQDYRGGILRQVVENLECCLNRALQQGLAYQR